MRNERKSCQEMLPDSQCVRGLQRAWVVAVSRLPGVWRVRGHRLTDRLLRHLQSMRREWRLFVRQLRWIRPDSNGWILTGRDLYLAVG